MKSSPALRIMPEAEAPSPSDGPIQALERMGLRTDGARERNDVFADTGSVIAREAIRQRDDLKAAFAKTRRDYSHPDEIGAD